MTRTNDAGRTRRTGFTLIELLLVLAILAILVALTAAAAIRVLGSQYVSTTRTTMLRANSRLQQQTAYIIDQARTETIPTATSPNDAYSLSASTTGGPSNTNRGAGDPHEVPDAAVFPDNLQRGTQSGQWLSGYPGL